MSRNITNNKAGSVPGIDYGPNATQHKPFITDPLLKYKSKLPKRLEEVLQGKTIPAWCTFVTMPRLHLNMFP